MKLIVKIMLSLFLLMVISSMPVSASIHNISGYVLDGGEGVLGATVTDNESIDLTVSNVTGYYILDGYTNDTNYMITASLPGHDDSSLLAEFANDSITNHNLTSSTISMTDFLVIITEVVTAVTSIFTAVMVVFMEPPLSLFIGIVIFVFIVGIVAAYLMGRKK